MKKLKFFLDTEFIEAGRHHPLYLLSIGIVCENGNIIYNENIEAPIELANPFVKENVFPHLDMIAIKNDGVSSIHYYDKNYSNYKDVDETLFYSWDIRHNLEKFIRRQLEIEECNKFEFWGYFCDYDWVLFCQLFGTMSELPKGFPYYCNDLKQLMKFVGEDRSLDELVGEKSNHNALDDAKQIKKGYGMITSQYKIEVVDNLKGRI